MGQLNRYINELPFLGNLLKRSFQPVTETKAHFLNAYQMGEFYASLPSQREHETQQDNIKQNRKFSLPQKSFWHRLFKKRVWSRKIALKYFISRTPPKEKTKAPTSNASVLPQAPPGTGGRKAWGHAVNQGSWQEHHPVHFSYSQGSTHCQTGATSTHRDPAASHGPFPAVPKGLLWLVGP